MKSMKTGLQLLAAVLMLVAAGILVWYLIFSLQNPDMLTDVTLVII